MKKVLFFIFVLAVSCVGQQDDPEIDPDTTTVDEPETTVENPPEEEGDYFRRSLILDFTGTWCVNCPKMEAAILEAQAQRPDRLVCVSVHCLAADKMAVMPLSKDLAARFGVNAYPSAVTDLDASSLITTSSAELLLAQCDRLLEGRPQAAGIRISSSRDGEKAVIAIEAKLVREGNYSLHYVLLEDGVVASQLGGSSEHVHNNILRAWEDYETNEGLEAGDVLKWTQSVEADANYRIVAFICRNGIVDNVACCNKGEETDYKYESL